MEVPKAKQNCPVAIADTPLHSKHNAAQHGMHLTALRAFAALGARVPSPLRGSAAGDADR